MERSESVVGLHFEENLSGYDNVYTLVAEKVAPVPYRETFLDLKRNICDLKLDTDRAPVDTLQQTWSELAVHRDAATDESMYQVFEFVIQLRG